jgi:hypothetical protein
MSRFVTPRSALAAIVGLYVVLAVLLVFLVPPWEPVDEDGHVRNVASLAAGHYYAIPSKPIDVESAAGGEPQQPPLYYLLLAGWQRALGLEAQTPHPRTATHVGFVPAPVAGQPFFIHGEARDAEDARRLHVLRLPGIIFGALAVILTAAIARRLSSDPWTPVAAAATVAFLPRLVFLTAGVNNDDLVLVLGSLACTLAVIGVTSDFTRTRRMWMSAAMGAVGGVLMLAKLTGAPLLIALAIAVALSARDRREAFANCAVMLLGAALVCGWWFVRNQSVYGDPLASGATRDYLGPFVAAPSRPIYQAFVAIPRGLWKSLWYSSGWNQFTWPWWAYLPFWTVTATAIVGLARRGGRPSPAVRRGILVLICFAAAGLLNVWILGLETPQHQGRVAFASIAAIACLIALGLERLGAPLLRAVLPVLGLCGTVIALLTDVIAVYR